MSNQRPYRILIGGGGTGGHVFPALAIADALKEIRPGTEFLFVGAIGKLEMDKVPEAGYPIEGLPVAGFQRRLTYRNITFFFRLLASMLRSRKIVRHFRPHVAVGVGGYASGPILRAAARKGVPVLIQEQNSYAGVTNRLLARSASTICVAYEAMEKYFPAERIVLTGNPVRQNLLKLSFRPREGFDLFGLETGTKVCLVMGGSLGAKTLNRSVAEGLEKIGEKELQLIWQCGEFYKQEALDAVEKCGTEGIRVYPFISRMDLAYGVADVIVSRAGALSISELCLVGRPVILVPSPNVAEDHQTRNAEALTQKKAAIMVPDREAPARLVDQLLELLEDDGRMTMLSENIRKLGIPDASMRIAGEVVKILEKQ